MKRSSFWILVTFFEDVFLIFLLGLVVSSVIYFSVSWSEIENEVWAMVLSPIISVLGVSVFRRGTLSGLTQGLPVFTVYVLVATISVMFILGYWPIGSLLLGFLGGLCRTTRTLKT